jgi:type IV secretory pathway protease TraF
MPHNAVQGETMNVRILNIEVDDNYVVATVVPADKAGRAMATYAGDCAERAVDAAWDWADRHGHVVVEA